MVPVAVVVVVKKPNQKISKALKIKHGGGLPSIAVIATAAVAAVVPFRRAERA
jgi:hypothetical protein